MTRDAYPPKGALTYPQWLLYRIDHPGMDCGPDVIDDRAWWQHLPGLNPYAELEQQAREAERNWAASSRVPVEVRLPEPEAEAGQ